MPGAWWWRSIGADGTRLSRECCFEVVEEIFGRLDADGEADQGRWHRERRIGRGGVRHARGMLDEALHSTQTLRELPDLRPRDEVDGLLLVREQERDHPAEVPHLPGRNRVAGVRRQTGVEDALDARVALEERGD